LATGGVTTYPKILFCSQTVKEKIEEKIEDSVHLAKIPEMKSISNLDCHSKSAPPVKILDPKKLIPGLILAFIFLY